MEQIIVVEQAVSTSTDWPERLSSSHHCEIPQPSTASSSLLPKRLDSNVEGATGDMLTGPEDLEDVIPSLFQSVVDGVDMATGVFDVNLLRRNSRTFHPDHQQATACITCVHCECVRLSDNGSMQAGASRCTLGSVAPRFIGLFGGKF